MTEQCTVVAEMRAQTGREEALREALLTLVERTRKEEGCVQYNLHVQVQDPGHFVFYEIWASHAHLDVHGKAPALTAFLARSGELLSEAPRIHYYNRIA
jgi:quinol monooxygenase YgiN